MADRRTDDDLRKQIAFLSNLIDSHKSNNQERNEVQKTLPNAKRNRSLVKWKSESVLDRRQSPNSVGKLTHDQTRDILNPKNKKSLTRNVNLPCKVYTTNFSSSPPTSSSIPWGATQSSFKKSKSVSMLSPLRAMAVRKSADLHTDTISNTATTSFNSRPFSGKRSNSLSALSPLKALAAKKLSKSGNMKWSRNGMKSPQETHSQTQNNITTSCHTSPSTNVQQVNPVQNSSFPKKGGSSLNVSSVTQQNIIVPSQTVRRNVAKIETRVNQGGRGIFPSEKQNLSSRKLDHSTSLRSKTTANKSPSLPTSRYSSRKPNDSSFPERMVHTPNINKANSNNIKFRQAITRSSLVSHERRVASTSTQVSSLLNVDKKTHSVTAPHRNNCNANIPSTAAQKGAQLTWKRGGQRMVKPLLQTKTMELSKDISQTPQALNRNQLQRGKLGKMSDRVRTIPGITKPIVIRRNLLRSSTVPRRSSLKWSKSVSLSNIKDERRSLRQRKFVYNSRFSLKRKLSNDGLRGKPRASLSQKQKNIGFVSRRMNHIATASRHNSRISKPSSMSVDHQVLVKKVKIGDNVYLIKSRGKSLVRTKNVAEPRRKYSVHIYRRPSLDNNVPSSSAATINKIFNRQNSFDINKKRSANKILKRTLQTVKAGMRKVKRQKLKSEEYCMFYNKFGKCTKHTKGICPYKHDRSKIAVCTRFLRGKCQLTDGKCPFSHQVDKDKMPICQYFLKGKCNRDECPYLHVNLGRQALVCEDFRRGYCPFGFKCKKKHVLECEEFSSTGKCQHSGKCKLLHRKRKQRKRQLDLKDEEDSASSGSKCRRKSSDGFLPLKGLGLSEDDNLPASGDLTQEIDEAYISLRIRPNFAKQKNDND